MKKKIIEALKLKFEGVSDAILERLADKLAKTITSEDGVQPAVDAVTFQKLLESYGDSRATEASATAVKNYEEKYSIKDGVPTKKQEPTPPPPTKTEDDVPAWAKVLIDANKTLTEKLTALEGKNTANKRLELLKEALKDVPESISKTYVKQLERMNFADDNDFNSWIEEAKADTTELANEFKSTAGGVGGTKGSAGGNGNAEPTKEEIDAIVSSFSN